jgi:hypothetical protein
MVIDKIMGVEHDCILSKQGDITIAFEVELPEIFTLSDQEYEALHQAWVKAIKVLPKLSVFHKQDWFVNRKYQPSFIKEDTTFLTRSSERFFNERPFLAHKCYVFLTKKPVGRKISTSLFSNLLRKSIVPQQVLSGQLLQNFLDSAGQFKRIIEDSGFITLRRLKEEDLLSMERKIGIIEKYCFLSESDNEFLIKDIHFKEGIQIGDQHCQLYTLGDAEDLPALSGSYPQRSLHGLNQVVMPGSTSYLDKAETTIAEYLKTANYTTAIIGKWHLVLRIKIRHLLIMALMCFMALKEVLLIIIILLTEKRASIGM